MPLRFGVPRFAWDAFSACTVGITRVRMYTNTKRTVQYVRVRPFNVERARVNLETCRLEVNLLVFSLRRMRRRVDLRASPDERLCCKRIRYGYGRSFSGFYYYSICVLVVVVGCVDFYDT